MSLTFGKLRAGEITFGNLRVAKMYFGNRLFWERNKETPTFDDNVEIYMDSEALQNNIFKWSVRNKNTQEDLGYLIGRTNYWLYDPEGALIENRSTSNKSRDLNNLADGTYQISLNCQNGVDKSMVPTTGTQSFLCNVSTKLTFDETNNLVMYEYTPKEDCLASSMTYYTMDTSLNKGALFTQVYDEYGFCIYSSWESGSDNYTLSLVTIGGEECEKVIYKFNSVLNLYAGRKYYFLSHVNRWDNSNKSKRYGYKDIAPYSNYKLLSTNNIIENPTTGTLPEDVDLLYAHTKEEYVSLFTEENDGNYIMYDGPAFSFGNPNLKECVGVTEINGGVYRGVFTDQNEANNACNVGDIIYENWGFWAGAGYMIKSGNNEWAFDGQWTQRPSNMPFLPVNGCYSQIAALPVQNSRNYKIEIEVQ